MTKKNPENERIKLGYFSFLRQADGKSEPTIRQIEKSILRFEGFTKYTNFKSFDQRQAIGFKAHLVTLELAPATILSNATNVMRFFRWLALQPGYKRQINIVDIDYLKLSDKDVRAASAVAEKAYPSLQMIERAVEQMPSASAIQKRDRAIMATVAATGIRDGALISLKLKHFDVKRKLVLQDPREVDTKFSKRIDTFLFPLSELLEQISIEWPVYLREELLFADHDPLFPKTAMGQDEDNCFAPVGLSRERWADASAVRLIFRTAFERAGLTAFSPHRFRNMIVSEMYKRQLSVAEFKAWSQNLGHEGAMTTLTSYGKLSLEEQGQLIRKQTSSPVEQPLTQSTLEEILRRRGL